MDRFRVFELSFVIVVGFILFGMGMSNVLFGTVSFEGVLVAIVGVMIGLVGACAFYLDKKFNDDCRRMEEKFMEDMLQYEKFENAILLLSIPLSELPLKIEDDPALRN